MAQTTTSDIRNFIDDAGQEMNKHYTNWSELQRVYELAANMDLSSHIVSHSQALANGVDSIVRQLALPNFDVRFIDSSKEDANIMAVLAKNGVENVLRGSTIHNAFYGMNGVFFNLVLKGNSIGYVSYEKGKIKIQCIPLSNVYLEKGTVSLEDDLNGLQTMRIGFVTRYMTKEALISKYPKHASQKDKLGVINSIPSVWGDEEVQIFKYFDFRKKEYFEITGNDEVLVKKTGKDFPCLYKTRDYFEALTEGNDKVLNIIKENLQPRNPFFMFKKDFVTNSIYATGFGHRMYESTVNQTKIESGTVLSAINNAIGFQTMNIEKGSRDKVQKLFNEALQNLQVGRPALMLLENDLNSPPAIGRMERIQAPISADEISLINSVVDRKGAANGVNVSGSYSTKYKNTQAILTDNQIEDDSIASYVTINLHVFKRMYETVINMMAEYYVDSLDRFTIEGIVDEKIKKVGYYKHSDLAKLIQLSELEVLMDQTSGVIPSSGARFQKAQSLLAMAAQSNARPEVVEYILQNAMQIAGIASSNQIKNEVQSLPQSQGNVQPQGVQPTNANIGGFSQG